MGLPGLPLNVSFLYKKSWKEWKTPGISHPHNSTPKKGCADITAAVMVKAKCPGPTLLFNKGNQGCLEEWLLPGLVQEVHERSWSLLENKEELEENPRCYSYVHMETGDN